MLPSGEYFLGRPRFFFDDSEAASAQGFNASNALLSLSLVSLLRGSEGGGLLLLLLLNGNLAVTGDNIEGYMVGPTVMFGGCGCGGCCG